MVARAAAVALVSALALSACSVGRSQMPGLDQEPGPSAPRSPAAVVYGTGEVPQVRPEETADGRLALPTAYPLQPGDAELWATLTRAQQERALAFLRTGGTIRSSLRGDQ